MLSNFPFLYPQKKYPKNDILWQHLYITITFDTIHFLGAAIVNYLRLLVLKNRQEKT
jgi:hypothetical protein